MYVHHQTNRDEAERKQSHFHQILCVPIKGILVGHFSFIHKLISMASQKNFHFIWSKVNPKASIDPQKNSLLF